MAEQQKYDIFISYSRKEAEFATRLRDDLSREGYAVFLDVNLIQTGELWTEQINEAINACQAFILIISPDSVQSNYVKREMQLAADAQKRIIPVVSRSTKIPAELEYQLAGFQFIEMKNQLYSAGFKMLSETLKQTGIGGKDKIAPPTQPEGKFSGSASGDISVDNEMTKPDRSGLDLNAFTTRTTTSEDGVIEVETLYQGKSVARSTIELDGDASMVVPMPRNKRGESELDKIAYELHQKNVQAAIASRALEVQNELANKGDVPDVETPDLMLAAIEANRLVNNRSQAVFNDRAQGEDQLGIKDEVEALAETLLLRDVEPPVAVGVIGGWGSGKSFVLYLINQYVQSTRAKKVKKGWPTDGNEKDPEIPAFVGHIYQINFNAWTYAKSDLWASLMDTIFSCLNQQMQLERLLAHKDFPAEEIAPSAEKIQASMLAGGDVFKKIYLETLQIDQDQDLLPWRKNLIHWSQHLLKETLLWNIMRGQQVETLEKLKDTEEQLKQLKLRRAQFEKDHPAQEITAETLNGSARQAYFQTLKGYLLAFISDELTETAKNELSKQDVSEDEIQKYMDEAKGLKGGLNTIFSAFKRSKIYWIWTLLFLVITLAVPFVWSTYAIGFVQRWVAQVVSFFITLLPLISALIAWIQKSVKFGLDSKQILEGAYATQQAKKAEQITNSTEKPIPQKISELQKEISEGSVAAYNNLISLLETQAEEQRQQIGPSAKYSNLIEFVQSRLDAATYENQLGLMHQVRQDIDELTYSLVDNARPDIFPRGRPRVILYIDDLDRCPPSRVVEMLEAVQLLLSTKLFIVILGLDTRYVTRALEKEYKEILQHEGDPSGLDYIEKIIQIPYRVRPIEPTGLRKYLEKQMDVEQSAQVAPQTPATLQKEPVQNIAPQPDEGAQPPAEAVEPIQHPAEASNPEPAEPALKEEQKAPEIELPAAVIQFKREDLEDLTACCQRIALTPRSIKRLVNVFKLMKIFWFRADKNAGLPERDRPRPVKQAAISLLALSSAYPEVMRETFVHLETLYRQGHEQTELYNALNNIHLPPGSANELAWQLQKYKADLAALKAIKGQGQDKFGQLTLRAFNLATFNIVRSFSFVGDPVYWTDGTEAASKSKRAAPSKRSVKGNQVSPDRPSGNNDD